MRKFKLLILLAAAMMTANMWAGTAMGSTGLEWEYADGTLTITYTGSGSTDMPNYTTATQPWKSYKTAITTVVLPAEITKLGNNAFNGCNNADLEIYCPAATPPILGTNVFRSIASTAKIFVPDAKAQDYANDTKWVGFWDYLYCATSGNHAPVPNGEGDFGAETNNLHWVLSNYVLTITGSGSTGDLASNAQPWNAYNKYIHTVYLPDGISYIGSDVFFGATNVESVYISRNPEGLTWNEDGDDFNRSPNKSTVCYVPSTYLDAYQTNFSAVNLTFSIAPWVSGDCVVTLLGNTMQITGTGAMADYADAASLPWKDYCNAVEAVVIKEGVTHIGAHAFDGCADLASISSEPVSAPTLGAAAFDNCSASLEITYPCLSYASYESNWSAYEAKFGDCVRPTNACGDGLTYETAGTYPEVILVISKTFQGTGAMDDYASKSDRPWKSLASSYTAVEIGDGVSHIGDNAFNGFSSIATLTAYPATAPTLGTDALTSINVFAQVIYPCGSYASYTAAWGAATPNLISECPTMVANADPANPGVYYSTFYHSSKKYQLPAGVEAYTAQLSGDELILHKLADPGQVIPAGKAVILKADHTPVVLTESDGEPVSQKASNLIGQDYAYAASANCYVLSGHSSDNTVHGVGFYLFTGTIPAHKAYLIYSGAGAPPKKMRFVFAEEQQATGLENAYDGAKAEKFFENGMLIIEKNGVRYNAQGQIVK